MRRGDRLCGVRVAVLLVCALEGDASAQVEIPAMLVSERRAVALALEHNLSLDQARLDAEVAAIEIARARAAWTPRLESNVASLRANAPSGSLLTGPQIRATDTAQTTQVGVAQRLPFGTEYRVTWNAANATTNNQLTRFNPQLTSAASIAVTQPLVRGRAIDPERADTAIARVDRRRADAQLEATVTATTRMARHAYWQWVYASGVLDVERESLRLARELLEQNRQRVAVGAIASVDLVEAEAEVARRNEAVLIASKDAGNAEDVLRRVILDPESGAFAAPLQRLPEEDSTPSPASLTVDFTTRLDVRLAQAAVDTDAVELRLRRNETRPDVSLQVSYTARSVGGDELLRSGAFPGTIIASASRSFSSTLGDLVTGRYPSWTAQVAVSYPLGASEADAQLAQASLLARRDQAEVSDARLAARTETAIVRRNVDTSLQRLDSTGTAVSLASRRLEGEQRKFNVGLSTSFFVFQAQRDLAVARAAALRAMLDYRRARADLEAVHILPLGLDQPGAER